MKFPNWTRDEELIVLKLYLSHDITWLKRISENSKEIVDTCQLLRKLPINQKYGNLMPGFRSPSSVHMKLMNFLSMDQRYGKFALSNGSRLDRMIWEEYAKGFIRLCYEVDAILITVN